MLMGDTVLIEELRHLISHHVAVIGYRDQRNFLAWLLNSFAGRGRVLLFFGSWGIAHRTPVYTNGGQKGHSNASNEECSGNCALHAVQVTK